MLIWAEVWQQQTLSGLLIYHPPATTQLFWRGRYLADFHRSLQRTDVARRRAGPRSRHTFFSTGERKTQKATQTTRTTATDFHPRYFTIPISTNRTRIRT